MQEKNTLNSPKTRDKSMNANNIQTLHFNGFVEFELINLTSSKGTDHNLRNLNRL